MYNLTKAEQLVQDYRDAINLHDTAVDVAKAARETGYAIVVIRQRSMKVDFDSLQGFLLGEIDTRRFEVERLKKKLDAMNELLAGYEHQPPG